MIQNTFRNIDIETMIYLLRENSFLINNNIPLMNQNHSISLRNRYNDIVPYNKSHLTLIKFITIVATIIFITKFFQSTPFETLFFQIQAVYIVIMFFYFLKELRNFKKYKEEPFLKYLLLLIIITPIYGAFRANIDI